MQLPSLNALRAFEAAARHGSFVQAGRELHVSPGAISRHVKLLELDLGVVLFERLPRGLKPTSRAATLQADLSHAFEIMRNGLATVSNGPSDLRVLSSPTFANRLLAPGLTRFTEAHPDANVSIGIMLSDNVEFDATAYDCGIGTFHSPVWPDDIRAELIRNEELTPLASPKLFNGRNRPVQVEDLKHEKLLQISACGTDWPCWFDQNGQEDPTTSAQGPVFDTGELAIQAAVEGLGVLIMDRLLVRKELSDGTLNDPFPNAVPVNNGYYFFSAARRWNEPLLVGFREWAIASLGNLTSDENRRPQ